MIVRMRSEFSARPASVSDHVHLHVPIHDHVTGEHLRSNQNAAIYCDCQQALAGRLVSVRRTGEADHDRSRWRGKRHF